MSLEAAGQIEREGAMTRADLHAHSSASKKPFLPILGRLDCPECFSPPERVYELALDRGMDFVALTDHDTIDGALELAERGFDHVIIGEEITTRFPGEDVSLHVLVWGISPKQHEAIGSLGLRDDVYALAHWLREDNVAHALAHPLLAVRGRLTADHIERCLLLFRGFELRNGAHSTPASADVLHRAVTGLTRERLCALEARHGMTALWGADTTRALVGGSDDHALVNLGLTWTSADGSIESASQFVDAIKDGRVQAGGRMGGAAALGRQILGVAGQCYARTIHPNTSARTRLIASKVGPLIGADLPRPSRGELVKDACLRRLPWRKRCRSSVLASLRAALPESAQDIDAIDDVLKRISTEGRRALRASIGSRDRHGVVDSALALAIPAIARAPEVWALFQQNAERALIQDLERTRPSAQGRPLRIALFTDTIADVNGVTRFVRTMARQSRVHGDELRIFTSTSKECAAEEGVHVFAPAGRMALPGYSQLDLVAPPVMEMLRAVDAYQPDVIHVSTPGPVGLVGLLAARMLRAPVVGTHHTDFPAFADRLFEGAGAGRVAASGLRGLYAQYDRVLARSEACAEMISDLGVQRERVGLIEAGVEGETFSPAHRDPAVWNRFAGAREGSVKALYVGRISAEKNVNRLLRVWRQVMGKADGAQLIVVGDGPKLDELRGESAGDGVVFLGACAGAELSALYASSDLFVFPSETDTLGQVVLEAQCSGLAAIVSDRGGPATIVEHGETGFVLPGADERQWVSTLLRLIDDAQLRRSLGMAGRARMERRTLGAMYASFRAPHAELARRERSSEMGRVQVRRNDHRAAARSSGAAD